MKTYLQTTCVFVIINLVVSGFAVAKNAPDEEVQNAVEVKAKETDLARLGAEAVAKLAQKQAEVAQRQAKDAALNNTIYALANRLSSGSRSSGTGTVLVIPAEETKTEDLIAINEDMSVMSRIFEKNLEQARIETVRSNIFPSRQDRFSMLLEGGGGEIQSMYLQGYGALFLMKVDFPLSPPPRAQEEKEAKKEEEGDPVWDQMRREIYEPEKVDIRRRTDRPESKYEAEKVENLKTTLIKALKHAANIRSLKPDESVILTITGRGEATGRKIATARVLPERNEILVQERTADGKMINMLVKGNSLDVLDDLVLSSPAILTIRAKKSDIDAFAKGDLDLDQFRQRTQMLTCPYLGGVAGSGAFQAYNYKYTGITLPSSGPELDF